MWLTLPAKGIWTLFAPSNNTASSLNSPALPPTPPPLSSHSTRGLCNTHQIVGSPAQEHWHLKELKTISKLLPRSHKPSARLCPLTTLSLSLLPEPMASSSSSAVSNLPHPALCACCAFGPPCCSYAQLLITSPSPSSGRPSGPPTQRRRTWPGVSTTAAPLPRTMPGSQYLLRKHALKSKTTKRIQKTPSPHSSPFPRVERTSKASAGLCPSPRPFSLPRPGHRCHDLHFLNVEL